MKSLFARLGVIGMIASGCINGPVYAKRDYEQYPDYRKDIALYNIKNILSNVCDSSSADENGFDCRKKECVSSHQASNTVGASTVYFMVCDRYEDRDISERWAELSSAQISLSKEGLRVQINGKDIYAKDARQASELQEAMQEYLR